MNKHVFVTFVDMSSVKDNYPIFFSQMKEDRIETWFLPPGYRIYQDFNDRPSCYRFSDQKSNLGNCTPLILWVCITAAHKHYQEKNLIEMLNKNARIE